MLRKIGQLLTMLFILLLLITGCKDSDDKSIDDMKEQEEGDIDLKIAFWGASGEEEALKEAAEGMIEEIDGLASISWEQFPSVSEFYSSIPTQSVIGKIPDIVMLSNEEQGTLIESGILEPLHITLDDTLYQEGVINEWKYDSELYGIPSTAAPALFVINDDIWREAGLSDYPANWQEVYKAAHTIKNAGYMPLCIEIHNLYHITQYLLSFGGNWNAGVDMNTAENREAISFILKMFDEGLAVTNKEVGKTWSGEVFLSKECVMTTGGTWLIGALKEEKDINYTFISIPGTDYGTAKSLHSYGFSVMQGCKNKEIAQQAIQYMTRAEAQEIRMKKTGDCPALVSLQEEYYKLYPELSFMRKDLITTKGFNYPTDTAILDNIRRKLEQRIYGKTPLLTAEEILSSTQ